MRLTRRQTHVCVCRASAASPAKRDASTGGSYFLQLRQVSPFPDDGGDPPHFILLDDRIDANFKNGCFPWRVGRPVAGHAPTVRPEERSGRGAAARR